METRARTRPMLRRAGLLAALTALLVPAVAGTATADAAKRSKKRSPVVTKITPTHAFVGETLTIRGRYFRRGVNKNTVAFKPRGKKVVFTKAEKGTTKLLKVTLPKRLEKSMAVQNGTPVPTRMQVRVLSARFGKRFTKLSRSPVLGPEKPPAPPKPPTADPDADCDGDGLKNREDGDDDNDLLGDALETTLKLDGCKPDSDGDAVEDGYEYAAAQDLNDDETTLVPYPQKLPYPNALDGTDAGTDHDGDALTLKDEYDLWKFVGNRVLDPLSYSAGEQYSVFTGGGASVRQPALSAAGYDKQVAFLTWAGQAGYATVPLAAVGSTVDVWNDTPEWWAARAPFDIRDMDRDGFEAHEATYYDHHWNGLLSDDERDEDADGLSNWAETVGCMTRPYWDALYDGESPYPLQYAAVRLDDADSDGDGVRDGADDQDHDDVPNVMECSRSWAADLPEDPDSLTSPPVLNRPRKGFVNPFNPCLPHYKSRTCKRIVTIGKEWAPFNADEEYYLIKN